jgi:hypothetical protein
MIRSLLVALAAPVLLSATVAIPITLHYGGPPPKRYQGDTFANVFFLHDIEPVCGKAPLPYVRFGCVSGRTMTVVHPCLFPKERYAQYLCHESGHRSGWPAEHGP